MSAFIPESGHWVSGSGCPLVPEADIEGTTKRRLLDHLIGSSEHRLSNCQAKRLGGLEIDEHLEFGGLLNRNITRFDTAKYLVDDFGSSPELI
jgi:hypothetical protein